MKIKFNLIYLYSLFFFVLGVSSIGALNFLYEIGINSMYNTVLALLSILFLYGLLSKKLEFKFNNYIRLFILLFIVISFSFVFTSFDEFTERKYFLFFGSGLLLSFFSSSIKPELYKYLPKAIIFFGLINILVLLGIFKKIGGIEELKWTMITEANLDVIYISRALGLGVLASFFYLKNKLLKILLVISFMLFMLILNEIGPILAIILSVFAFYSRKNSAYLLMAIFLGVIFYFFVIENFITDLTLEGVLNDPRVDIYVKNFNYFLNHPFFGIGIAGSVNIVGEYQSAHNIFLEIVGEFGIMGLIPFVMMVLLLIDKFLKNKNFLFSYLWFYCFIVVQFSGDIALNTMFWTFSAIFMSMSINEDDVLIRLNV